MVTALVVPEMTQDAWAALPENEPGELVDGALEEEEVPDVTHETVVRWLMFALGPYFMSRGGLVFASGVKLAVRPGRGRMADVICYGPGKKPPRRGIVRIAPDIVVEVVSPSAKDERRDRLEKPEDYAAFGVRHYWLVDPELRSFEVWELDSRGRYVHVCAALRGRVENVPGCEGLVIELDALWADVDALSEEDADPQ